MALHQIFRNRDGSTSLKCELEQVHSPRKGKGRASTDNYISSRSSTGSPHRNQGYEALRIYSERHIVLFPSIRNLIINDQARPQAKFLASSSPNMFWFYVAAYLDKPGGVRWNHTPAKVPSSMERIAAALLEPESNFRDDKRHCHACVISLDFSL